MARKKKSVFSESLAPDNTPEPQEDWEDFDDEKTGEFLEKVEETIVQEEEAEKAQVVTEPAPLPKQKVPGKYLKFQR